MQTAVCHGNLNMQVLLGGSDGLLVCELDTRREEAASSKHVQLVSPAPNGVFVAVFTSAKVAIWTGDLARIVSVTDVEEQSRPCQMEWCGSDAVLLLWEVGPSPDKRFHHLLPRRSMLAPQGSVFWCPGFF